MTYEQYLANEELKEDYTWEEVQEMYAAANSKKPFADYHPYWNVDPLHMGSVIIPAYVEDMEIPYEHPDLNAFMSAQGRAAYSDYENSYKEWD